MPGLTYNRATPRLRSAPAITIQIDARNHPDCRYTRRSFRGHLGRLKAIGQATPEIMQHVLGLEQAAARLFKLEAEDGATESTAQVSSRDPAHFRANGRNLSEAGRDFIFGLYDVGFSIRGAAARIGISLKAAADYRSAWMRRGSVRIS